MARVEDKAKYVAFPWMVECEVNGYDAGIWFSQLGYNLVTMLSIEVWMANMSLSLEYATVCRQDSGKVDSGHVESWVAGVAVAVQDMYRFFLLPK